MGVLRRILRSKVIEAQGATHHIAGFTHFRPAMVELVGWVRYVGSQGFGLYFVSFDTFAKNLENDDDDDDIGCI